MTLSHLIYIFINPQSVSLNNERIAAANEAEKKLVIKSLAGFIEEGFIDLPVDADAALHNGFGAYLASGGRRLTTFEDYEKNSTSKHHDFLFTYVFNSICFHNTFPIIHGAGGGGG
jgi:hypothetical protein